MWRATCLLIVALLMTSGPAFAKPNIVLILADDLGYGEVGARHAGVPTPNIDAIASSGVTFTDGYVTAPSCVPSRAGLLTGRYQQELGFYGNPPMPRPANTGLPEGQATLADALRAQGYHTGMIGKWHLGDDARDHPQQHGFDEFFGVLESDHPYLGEQEESVKPFSNPILRGTTPVPASGYLTDRFASEAASFIRRNAAQPFFLYLPFTATHGPLQAKPEVLARFADLRHQRRRLFAAVLSSLDDAVGEVTRAIADAGIADDTLIVFLGDNGCGIGHETGCRNTPLRGWKYSYYEGGIRIPFMMSWPGQIPAGGRYGEPVSALDLFPTFVQAAGGTPPRFAEGVNLLSYLRGAEGAPHDYLFWGTQSAGAVRHGRWKLVNGALYDLGTDISEQHDLAPAKLAVVADLLQARDEWIRKLAPSLW